MFFFILLTFLQILHSKIPSPWKLVKTRHIWRHDLQTESTGSRRSELIGDTVNVSTTRSRVELCRYKRVLKQDSSESRFLPTPPAFDVPVNGVSVGVLPSRLVRKKLERCGYTTVKNEDIFIRFVTDTHTDTHTDIAWRHRPRLCIASRKKNDNASMKEFCEHDIKHTHG